MNTVDDVVAAIFRMAFSIPGISDEDVLFEAIDKLPADHEIHLLTAIGFRCNECGHAGFVKSAVLNFDTGGTSCPVCDADGTLRLLEGGVA